MIHVWVTFSSSCNFPETNSEPKHIIPDPDFLMIRMDYMAFYFPKILFYKFGYIRALLETEMKTETRCCHYAIGPEKVVDMVDLSREFLEYTDIANINYRELSDSMFYIFTGDLSKMKIFIDSYGPLIGFLEYLGLDEKLLNVVKNT